jgi:hypothetical protein
MLYLKCAAKQMLLKSTEFIVPLYFINVQIANQIHVEHLRYTFSVYITGLSYLEKGVFVGWEGEE